MQLKKQQVRALLDIMSNEEHRLVLCGLCVKDGHAIATDGYHAVRLATSMNNTWIPRYEIVKWYKLASSKDTLTDVELQKMAGEPGNCEKYPPLATKVFDVPEGSSGAVDTIGVNPKLMMNVEMALHGKISGIKWRVADGIRFVTGDRDCGTVMGVK